MRNKYRYLDTNGDGTGTKEANGDHSSAEEILFYQPPINSLIEIHRLIIFMEDATGMRWDRYGSLAGGLTTGIVVRVSDDSGVQLDLTDGLPVKTNGHWRRSFFDGTISARGGGNDVFAARWSLFKSGEPVTLRCNHLHQRLEVVLNDNLTGLVSHTFQAQCIDLNVVV